MRIPALPELALEGNGKILSASAQVHRSPRLGSESPAKLHGQLGQWTSYRKCSGCAGDWRGARVTLGRSPVSQGLGEGTMGTL